MPARFEASEHGKRLGAASSQKAGKARMDSMSPVEKTKFQKQAANSRWSKKGNNKHEIPRRTNG